MKRQLIALMMVTVMVASVSAVAATTVSAATATTWSITTSTATPLVNQQFTILGNLKAGTTNLANKPVHLESHKKNSDGTWTAWGNLADTYKRTDGSGTVSSTRTLTTPGVREYRWHYNGTTTYAAARSSPVTVTVKQMQTWLSLIEPPIRLGLNGGTTLSGYLQDPSGAGIPGQPIQLYVKKPGQSWTPSSVMQTDSTGKWSTYVRTSLTGLWYFYVKYSGDSTHQPSQSQVWGIAVNTKVPTTPIIAHPDHVAVNTPFSVTVHLNDFHGHGVSGAVQWYRSWNDPNNLSYVTTTRTDSNGLYTWGQNIGSAGTAYYRASYGGDAVYASSGSTTVSVTAP